VSKEPTFEEMVMEHLDGLVKSFLDNMKIQLEGSNFGAHEPNDQQFIVWFQNMMRMDPLWAQALWFVEGGRDELYRYSRLMGVG
jgi:hypothetical protein